MGNIKIDADYHPILHQLVKSKEIKPNLAFRLYHINGYTEHLELVKRASERDLIEKLCKEFAG